MTPSDFEYLRALLKERSGLIVTTDKQYLLESRLLPIARRVGVNGLAGLVAKLRAPGAAALAVEVVEAMTTNESLFFRDKLPFEHFKETMLPALIAARATRRRIRIWCAAASTGQEPYSLAMILRENAAKLAGFRFEIVATDLCNDVLERARAGVYTQFEVQRGLPIALLVKYFTQQGESWEVSPDIRRMVEFRQFNLLQPFTSLGTFDIVFCRNVLIYFDLPRKADVLERISQLMMPDGYLVLGAAETVVGITGAFKTLDDKRCLYQPSGMPTVAAPPLQPIRPLPPVTVPRLVAFGGR